MSDAISWVLVVIGGLVAMAFGVQSGRLATAKKKLARTEDELAQKNVQIKVSKAANEIKDELAGKQKKNNDEQQTTIEQIADVPEEKEVPINEDVKKLAADQSARAHDRARRMQERRAGSTAGHP
jgi:type II secretory pathway pseudopilin PulG